MSKFFFLFYGIIETEDQSRDHDFQNRPLEPTSSPPANFLPPETALDSPQEENEGVDREGAQYANPIYKDTRQFTYRGCVSLSFQHLENNLRPLELSTEPSSDKTSTSIQKISHPRKCHPSAIFCPQIKLNGKRRTGPNVTVTQYVAPCHATPSTTLLFARYSG